GKSSEKVIMKIFNEQHDMFRATVRAFVEKEVMPHVEEWEVAGRMPKAVFRRMGELGFLGLEYDEKYGGAGADVMMTAVLHEECARSRSGSFAMAVGVHCDMASPHLYWTGSEALKEKYLPAICGGETMTALAVTEPGGGSDVAAIRTRAVKDGQDYVVNGAKMFITNGAMAERALEDTIAYVRERQAFGGPLSDKQAVRHRLAEMATDVEAGRWLTYAGWQKYAAGEDAVREVSMVKLFTAEMVNRVAYGCVQLHGGYGYMREYPVERFARDARLMTIGGGTSEIMKDIIAKAIVR